VKTIRIIFYKPDDLDIYVPDHISDLYDRWMESGGNTWGREWEDLMEELDPDIEDHLMNGNIDSVEMD
jgi:hypothetical protein